MASCLNSCRDFRIFDACWLILLVDAVVLQYRRCHQVLLHGRYPFTNSVWKPESALSYLIVNERVLYSCVPLLYVVLDMMYYGELCGE